MIDYSKSRNLRPLIIGTQPFKLCTVKTQCSNSTLRVKNSISPTSTTSMLPKLQTQSASSGRRNSFSSRSKCSRKARIRERRKPSPKVASARQRLTRSTRRGRRMQASKWTSEDLPIEMWKDSISRKTSLTTISSITSHASSSSSKSNRAMIRPCMCLISHQSRTSGSVKLKQSWILTTSLVSKTQNHTFSFIPTRLTSYSITTKRCQTKACIHQRKCSSS